MVGDLEEARTTVELLKPNLSALPKQVPGEATPQCELPDAEDATSRLEARWKSACEHAKSTERRFLQVAQQITAAFDKPAQEKSHWRAFAAALINVRDVVADQSSPVANARQFLETSLQKTTEDFFMPVLDHDCPEGLVFRTNMFKHCYVIETTARVLHGYIRRVNAEGYGHAPSLPEFGANDNSAVCSSLGASGDGGSSSGSDASSKALHGSLTDKFP